jgi:NADH:ubiquinone oxidoreductase subunit E
MAYPEDEAILEDLKAGLKSFGKERWNLSPLLQMIQQKHAYLPNETIKVVARHLEIAPCEVYGVATYTTSFASTARASIPPKCASEQPAMSGAGTLF